jgi:hypothetical protein
MASQGQQTLLQIVSKLKIFTGLPRAATVIAAQQSAGFADLGMQVKVLQNVISLLSERLASADTNIEDYAGKLRQVKDEHGLIDGLE